MRSINPANGELIRDYVEMGDAEVDARLSAARSAFAEWRRTDMTARAAPMRRAAGLLRARKDELAILMAREMGKPITQGGAEIDKCAWVCEHYADHAAALLAPEPVATDASRSYVAYQPLGAVLAVMPWNFPFWQVFRFAAPSLMAGNVGLLKHASNVSGCALAIEEVMRSAGFPEGAFATLLIGSGRLGRVIDDPRVAAVTLTGSTEAGRSVAAAAGRALKKLVLELGGSDPYVILADADLAAAVETCAASRLINSGQSCIAAKRFVAVAAVAAEVEERFVARMKAARVGDPLDRATEVGPLARADLRDELHQQVLASVAAGARVLTGGTAPDRPGAWYPPTVLGAVGPGMPAYHDELFGPVAALITARDQADAIRVANDSRFGLGAAVFTRNAELGRRLADEELEAGSCFVNASVRSDPRLPFGGIKESGYGRELGAAGIRELVNVKTVFVA